MATPSTSAPILAHRFVLEIDGISAGSFVSCTGLGARRAVLRYGEGGATEVRAFHGDSVPLPIVFERGVSRDVQLHEWYDRGDRRDGAVVILAPDGAEAMRWVFTRAWPCRWEGPALDARHSGVAIERLEIVHEGVTCIRR